MSAPAQAFTALPPFSRDWWIVYWKSLANGRPAHTMAAFACRGRSWTVPDADLPTDDERSACAPVVVSSPGFERWERWALAVYGVRLPKPDRARVAFLPQPAPPDGMDDCEAA